MKKEKRKYLKRYSQEGEVNASAKELFDYIDDFRLFSVHMNKSSWMMGGGKMELFVDSGEGRKIGSVVKMSGHILGLNLFLEEVVIKRVPFRLKSWETVGDLRLLVIGHYRMDLEVLKRKGKNFLRVSLSYNMPKGHRIIGALFSKIYAKWCVHQMISGAKEHF